MIDLDVLVPLPEPWNESLWANSKRVQAELHRVRLAAWNAALDAAIKTVEHEAFPSELPRFGVATDKLRDMRIEPKPK